jgi:glutamate dehydrogenase (NAD(P)+)
MAWFYDTYSQSVGHAVPEVVTGKPLVLGGAAGRQQATGLGVVFAIEAVLDHLAWPLTAQRFVIQGLGNVGAVVAAELHARGAAVLGVSDVRGAISNPAGLDIPAVLRWKAANEYVTGFPAGEPIAPDALLEIPCDVLVPAALERQITRANAPHIRCRLLAEAANAPTTPEADEILEDRGILVLPDILTNAGGVTVSYFEWVQSHQKYSWNADEIRERLRVRMRDALARVLTTSEQLDVRYRTAALSVAIARVAEAAKLRAVYP